MLPVPRARQRTCALCGHAFAILIPEGFEETERDRLCPECLRLPPPPDEAEATT